MFLGQTPKHEACGNLGDETWMMTDLGSPGPGYPGIGLGSLQDCETSLQDSLLSPFSQKLSNTHLLDHTE